MPLSNTPSGSSGKSVGPRGLLFGAALLAIQAVVGVGCVERRIQVTSEPPGATVWLNDVEIGTTPTEADFRYFGIYDVRLRKAGYEPIATKMKAEAPFYEFPGPDLVAEALPGTQETVLKWHFKLETAQELRGGDAKAADDALIQRANELRAQVPSPEEAAQRQSQDKKAAEAKAPAGDAKATDKK